MVVSTPSRSFTYEDLLQLPEDGLRHEILDGEHVVTPSPVPRHQLVVYRLSGLFYPYFKANPIGQVFPAPLDVLLSTRDVVEPDLFFVAKKSSGIVNGTNVQGAPELAIEILSPGTRSRDLGRKRERYELLGVGEYWVLDPERDTASLFRRATPEAAEFESPIVVAAGADERLSSPLFPGLEIPLREVFER
jgi:Uma2 family endonuclease